MSLIIKPARGPLPHYTQKVVAALVVTSMLRWMLLKRNRDTDPLDPEPYTMPQGTPQLAPGQRCASAYHVSKQKKQQAPCTQSLLLLLTPAAALKMPPGQHMPVRGRRQPQCRLCNSTSARCCLLSCCLPADTAAAAVSVSTKLQAWHDAH